MVRRGVADDVAVVEREVPGLDVDASAATVPADVEADVPLPLRTVTPVTLEAVSLPWTLTVNTRAQPVAVDDRRARARADDLVCAEEQVALQARRGPRAR